MSRPATRRLKVFIVSSRLEAMGGAEKNVFDVARGLRQRCDVTVIGMKCGPLLDTFRRDGIDVEDAGVSKILSFRGLLSGYEFLSRLKAEKVDVVLTYHHDADIWAGFAATLAGVPVVSSRRDLGYLLSPAHVWLYRAVNHIFFKIVTVADAVKRQVMKTQWAPESSIVTIHNGLEFQGEALSRDEARRELGLALDRPVVGTVASFRPVKGQEVLARAAADVLRRKPGVQFVVIGDTNSTYFEKVRALMAELGVDNDVKCVGAKANVHRLLPAFDVFALPSFQEGFSNALVEAMAAGLPAVASAVGGNPEAIDHGVNGLLFDAGDAPALARHLLALLDNEETRARMGAAAAARVAETFSYDGMIDKVHGLLLEAAGLPASDDESVAAAAQGARP